MSDPDRSLFPILGKPARRSYWRHWDSRLWLRQAGDWLTCSAAHEPAAAAKTIRLAAEAGAVGGSIEDYTGDPANPIYDFDLAVERVSAAVEVAHSLPVPFLLTARAENLLHGRDNLNDTIRRLQAFAAAGADVLYAPGMRNLDEVREVVQAVNRPVNVVIGWLGRARANPLGHPPELHREHRSR
jgi:phosphoenolpyruvate phosphomutase-like protein